MFRTNFLKLTRQRRKTSSLLHFPNTKAPAFKMGWCFFYSRQGVAVGGAGVPGTFGCPRARFAAQVCQLVVRRAQLGVILFPTEV